MIFSRERRRAGLARKIWARREIWAPWGGVPQSGHPRVPQGATGETQGNPGLDAEISPTELLKASRYFGFSRMAATPSTVSRCDIQCVEKLLHHPRHRFESILNLFYQKLGFQSFSPGEPWAQKLAHKFGQKFGAPGPSRKNTIFGPGDQPLWDDRLKGPSTRSHSKGESRPSTDL